MAALAAPAESERDLKSSFSSSYTTGYTGPNGFSPVSATGTFDIGRFGDLSRQAVSSPRFTIGRLGR